MKPLCEFLNRKQELDQIRRRLGAGQFGYVTGRRRIGKTALLRQACRKFGGVYHQAVEGTPGQQLVHAAEELSPFLPVFKDVVPKNWTEFFRLLSTSKLPPLLVFDEFPYWVEGDPSLPSLMQQWVDHELVRLKTTLVVSGSSQAMLYSQFLSQGSPLFGRASFRIHLEPMSYAWFVKALGYRREDSRTFLRFCLVGGVPHYWKLMPSGSPQDQAERLYFEPSAILAEEPVHWIRDERVSGNLAKAILDLVGRGVHKPSELGARLGVPQGNLSRPLALLLELGLITKEIPFGESSHSTKRVLYRIQDPALSFYYGTFLPFRNLWASMKPDAQAKILTAHAARHWENYCRTHYPGSGRYWEAGCELDLVALQKETGAYVIAECKWGRVKPEEKVRLTANLKAKFEKSGLARRLASKKIDFKVLSIEDLGPLTARAETLL